MSEINWGMINSGGAFESLMHALVFAEDSDSILFGRPGKDSGQDARSLDGTHIYQAKYYSGLKMDKAVELALAELTKIKLYKTPGHANYNHWRFAKRWTLVANITKNPNDLEKWVEVEQAFQKEGFKEVDYWGLEILEQKLIQHPEIRDVFFEGTNRTLVGLRESYEWLRLTSPGKSFIDVDYVGHGDLFAKVKEFSESSKRLLTIQGDHCSGISRFLYEVMNKLADSGKRVYWGLSREMDKSSSWFKHLQSSEETYVIIDDVDSRDLVMRIREQMSSVENSNWKVIIASHTENVNTALQPIRTIRKELIESIELLPLDKEGISVLANECIPAKHNLPSAEVLYTSTQGLPGWLTLLLEASVHYGTSQFVITDDFSSVVKIVTDECLQSIPVHQRVAAQKILRWTAAWDTLKVDERAISAPELVFLRGEVPDGSDVSALLNALVNTGLVHNWGVDKRCFAVEPSIVRQEILRDWLLQKSERGHVLNSEGYSLVKKMIRGEVPRVDAVLRSVSNIAISYMGRIQTKVVLNPVFDAFTEEAKNGTIFEQASIIELLKNVGWAHPDRALEVVSAIRKNPKDAQTIHNAFYGDLTIDAKETLADAAECIFQYGGCITSESMARRYLVEINELFKLEGAGTLTIKWRNSCESKLLKLMRNNEVAEYYISVGNDIVDNNIDDLSSSDFLKSIAKAMLSPERGNGFWTKYSFTMNRYVISPGSKQWKIMLALRKKLFTRLLNKDNNKERITYWELLADSHHAFFRVATSGNGLPMSLCEAYMMLIKRDLRRVLCVSRKHGTLSLAEFTAAREMWSWYLMYGKLEKHPVTLAKRCESIGYESADWGLQNLFAFTTSQKAASAIDLVERKLRLYSTIDGWKTFFAQSKQYLNVARGDRRDLADGMRISDLAMRFANDFSPLDGDNIINEVVKSILSSSDDDSLEMRFAIQLCDCAIKMEKMHCHRDSLVALINELLKWSCNPARLLWHVYAAAHPSSVGPLTIDELNIVTEKIKGLSLYETTTLLAQFVGIGKDIILDRVGAFLKKLDIEQASNCMSWFIASLWLSFLRYEYNVELIPCSWILSQISDLNLDGGILGQNEADELAKRSTNRQGMAAAVTFFERRFALEKGKPYSSFQVLPYEFNSQYWFTIDSQDEFNKLCALALQHRSFLSVYELPKFLSRLDSKAISLSKFACKYLHENDNLHVDELYAMACLLAECEHETEGWRAFVSSVCRYCEKCTEKERLRIYSGFQHKMQTSSWRVGTVPQEVIDAVENAQKLLNDEDDNTLVEYRQWVLQGARDDLARAKEIAEEELHDGA